MPSKAILERIQEQQNLAMFHQLLAEARVPVAWVSLVKDDAAEDPDHNGWFFTIHSEDKEGAREEYDRGPFTSAGSALNAAIKWAEGREWVIGFLGQRFDVSRKIKQSNLTRMRKEAGLT